MRSVSFTTAVSTSDTALLGSHGLFGTVIDGAWIRLVPYIAWPIARFGKCSKEAKRTLDTKMGDFARRSETEYQLEAMIGIAQTLDGMSVMPDNLDSNPFLLNCKNGVVDLKSGTPSRMAKAWDCSSRRWHT